ncbi:SMI1/KNR4 family protein [Streptomyces cyslabdanicus]|uniref:SMI1/KNR4 family protein n=1 Tax=Streptomyces cyslabdanicus TaxID=1470456 RepID=UPI004043DB35
MIQGDQIRAEQTRAAWARIEAWLRNNAPRNYAALPPPCTEEEIRAHEARLRTVLPADVRAFYLLRNGTGHEDEFDGPEPKSMGPRRDAEWERWEPLAQCCYFLPEDTGIHPLQTRYYLDLHGLEEYVHLKYLPLISNGEDGLFGDFVDLTPGSETYGQLGYYSRYDATKMRAQTLAEYLTGIADAFDQGRGWPDGDIGPPPVVRGRLDWDS